jgi:hypothetical protein
MLFVSLGPTCRAARNTDFSVDFQVPLLLIRYCETILQPEILARIQLFASLHLPAQRMSHAHDLPLLTIQWAHSREYGDGRGLG